MDRSVSRECAGELSACSFREGEADKNGGEREGGAVQSEDQFRGWFEGQTY